MKLIKPSVEILEQGPGIQGIYDMIELCGKTSYKSEVKGGKTAEDFVSARVNEGHYAVLEFGTVYLNYPDTEHFVKYEENPYTKLRFAGDGIFAITTNLRVLVENGWTLDLEYLCEPTEYHMKRYTARIITDRGVSHELVRHRSFSYCQESTRYCNYSKDKFGNELTFIIPSWEDLSEQDANVVPGFISMGLKMTEAGEKARPFYTSLIVAESQCLKMLENGYTPQEARQVLPNALKTEICMCGDKYAWDHFFELRYYGLTGKPHPDMYKISSMLYGAFKEKGIQF